MRIAAVGHEGHGIRSAVLHDSWQRSLRYHHGPAVPRPGLALSGPELTAYRSAHPLAALMPVIRRLLVQPAADTGLLVAVGDELGRLLWVEGDSAPRTRAEDILFVPGADWSEASVGTSAPGTALAIGADIQVRGTEHFSPLVHGWSCTAVPLHDPQTGAVLGVVDVTGSVDAVAASTLALLHATVAAAETQLLVDRLRAGSAPAAPPALRSAGPERMSRDRLLVLGRDSAVLQVDGRGLDLSLRHSELLTLLALHPGGLSADQLAVMAYPEGVSVTTVRAEMLRLRNLLARYPGPAAGFVPQSRPYRLPRPLAVDALQVRTQLERGTRRLALENYRGPVLPRSTAPAITALRSELSLVLREAMLSDAGSDTLLDYLSLPEARTDVEAWALSLRLLPLRSPRRAAVMAHLAQLEHELA